MVNRENSDGTVHPGGNFPEKKVIPFEVLPFSRFYRWPKFSVPFVWITSARLHVERKRIYFVNGTTQSCSCFRCQKNIRTIWRKFFTEISVLMVSAQGLEGDPDSALLLFFLRNHFISNFCHLYPWYRFLSQYRIPYQDFGESRFP